MSPGFHRANDQPHRVAARDRRRRSTPLFRIGSRSICRVADLAGRPVGERRARAKKAWACLSQTTSTSRSRCVRETLPSKDRSPIHQNVKLGYWCPRSAPRGAIWERFNNASRRRVAVRSSPRRPYVVAVKKHRDRGLLVGAAYGEELHQIVDGAISEWPVPLTSSCRFVNGACAPSSHSEVCDRTLGTSAAGT